MSNKTNSIESYGIVVKVLPKSDFEIKLENGRIIIAYPCGKIRKKKQRISAKDKVIVTRSPTDLTRGIITRVISLRQQKLMEERAQEEGKKE